MPISGGFVYVSVAYGSITDVGALFELDSAGRVLASFTVRVLATSSPSLYPVSQSISMGEDSGYVYYDGWFYGPGGPSVSLTAEDPQLASTDSSSFYVYSPLGGSSNGACQPGGNEEVLSSYHPGPGTNGTSATNWTAYAYVGPCTRYDPQLLGASTGGGLLVALFGAPYFSNSLAGALPGYDPYIVAISQSGEVKYDAQAPTNGFAAIATDGSNVYLSLPELDEVDVLSLSTNSTSTYNLGFPATDLICDFGLLFAVSRSQVNVYDGSMQLIKSISLEPLSLSSFSNSLSLGSAMQAPSFVVLNDTSYAALAVNATGFSSLVVGSY